MLSTNTIKPDIIFVIGNPCTGKTSFITAVKSLENFIELDDIYPLQEIFKGDEILLHYSNSKSFVELWMNYIKDLKYTNNFWPDNFANLCGPIFSSPNISGGYNISDPRIWDVVLQLIAKKVVPGENYFISFARGYDLNYLKIKNVKQNEVYKSSFNVFLNELNFSPSCLIIYFKSPFDERKKRNTERYKNGGHFVSDRGMNEIYRDENIDILSVNDRNYLEIGKELLPIFIVDIPNVFSIYRKEFYLKIYKEALFYFNTLNQT